MKKKKKEPKKPPDFIEKVRKIKAAGITHEVSSEYISIEPDAILPLSERIQQLLGLVKAAKQKPTDMIYFVMYDIEDNRVRNQIAKYLIRKGLSRVQKSIFIGNTDRSVFDHVQADLKEVQECYENTDSIILIPISTDEVRAMKLIGQNIDFDLVLKNRNTLFF